MKSEVLIDYLTFTVRGYDNPLELIKEVLEVDPDLFELRSFSSIPGYGDSLLVGNISVNFNPREDNYFQNMGMCVSMTGTGCRYYEKVSEDKIPMEKLIKKIAKEPDIYQCSRIDVACDDRQGLLPFEKILEKIRTNSINSRISKRSVVEEYTGKYATGITGYIGSRSSDFFCRIYDKAKQLYDPIAQSDLYALPWNRCELVFKHEYAQALILQFLDDGFALGTLAAQVLNDKFMFIEQDDSNISRCSVCSWWAEFLETMEEVHLMSFPAIQHTVDEMYDWLRNQIGKSLAIIHQTMGFGAIQDLYLDGSQNFKRKHYAIIESYKRVLGVS